MGDRYEGSLRIAAIPDASLDDAISAIASFEFSEEWDGPPIEMIPLGEWMVARSLPGDVSSNSSLRGTLVELQTSFELFVSGNGEYCAELVLHTPELGTKCMAADEESNERIVHASFIDQAITNFKSADGGSSLTEFIETLHGLTGFHHRLALDRLYDREET